MCLTILYAELIVRKSLTLKLENGSKPDIVEAITD